MILSSAITVFGLLFGRQLMFIVDQNEIFSKRRSNQLWIIFIVIQILNWRLCVDKPIQNICLQILTGIVFRVLCARHLRTRMFRFRRHHLPLLDYLILQLRSGTSIKEALKSSKRCFPAIEWHVSEILSAMEFRGRKFMRSDLVFELAMETILSIGRSSSRIVDRLAAYRSKVRTESFFRQKSEQLSLQVEVQSIVLSLLYWGLVIFDFMNFEYRIVITNFGYSFPLYGIGIIAIIKIPKGFKWKE